MSRITPVPLTVTKIKSTVLYPAPEICREIEKQCPHFYSPQVASDVSTKEPIGGFPICQLMTADAGFGFGTTESFCKRCISQGIDSPVSEAQRNDQVKQGLQLILNTPESNLSASDKRILTKHGLKTFAEDDIKATEKKKTGCKGCRRNKKTP